MRSARSERVKLLDFTRGFCDDAQCYAAAGGLQIYFDSTHIQANYARQFIPELEAQIRQLLPVGR